MKFSEAWLRTFTDPPISSAALQERLTMAGLEVEDAAPAAPPFDKVVVGLIRTVEPHPGADRLRVCRVDIGSGEPLQIVCGAPNAAAGMRVPCALVGAELPGGIAIRKATMRGVDSYGMLCSARELGIAEDASGLLALPGDAPPGASIRDVLRLDDRLITLKLTPNRADCLSLFGIAREVAAITGAALRAPDDQPAPVHSAARREVVIEDSNACPRFASRIIEGIDPKAPTPAWMRERLERSGIRSISAVVDITNYVMLEIGQPLHAYDDRLLDGRVVVRFARPGEKLVLLNEDVLDLEPDLLLVADEKKPLGLAGIMGGEHSGINDTTTTVFLEGAFWNPAVIQGKSRRLGFASDAGYRFERGVDPALGPRGVERATQLILAICGGRAGPLNDVCGPLPQRPSVRVREARVRRILGVDLPDRTIEDCFRRLGFTWEREGDALLVLPPSYRFDLAIEEDFIEEVARLYGYDAILPHQAAHRQRMLADPEERRTPSSLKRRLVARDWQEVITFSFVSSAVEASLFPGRPEAQQPIRVLNPIASHLDVMRTTLASGLIEVLRTNLARREDRVRIFEAARCFERGEPHRQPLRLGGLAFGDAVREQWGSPKRPVDIFDVKGDLEALLAPRRIATVAAPHPALHPGRSARVDLDGKPAGWLGELHPRLVKVFELPRAPVLFELDLAALCAVAMPQVRPIARQPRVRRDMALVVDEALPAATVLDALRRAAPGTVEAIELFDVYRGPGIENGKKSLAILVLMQDTERTLTDADSDAIMAGLLKVVVEDLHGSLRK